MPEMPTTARGAATRRRILDAAAEEFAQRGIAGARVERILAAAHTNKAQLYGYFGSKDGLFDAVVADCVGRTAEAVPFDAADLPGWAVSIYDQNLRQPTLIRLIAWIRLERRPTGPWFDAVQHEHKLVAVTEAQKAGRLRSGSPFELLTLIVSMASAWSPASGVYTASPGEPAAEHERRRDLLRESVARVVAP